MQRLRIQRRRLAAAVAAGVLTGALVMTLAPQPDVPGHPGGPGDDAEDASTSPSGEHRPATTVDRPAPDERILALDRHSVPVPVAVGDPVEVIGLTPTALGVTSDVIADRAVVVGRTDDAVLVRLSAREAHQALETAAIGSLAVLGLGSPPSNPDDS